MERALSACHEVTALVRDASKLKRPRSGLRIIEGDAREASAVADVVPRRRRGHKRPGIWRGHRDSVRAQRRGRHGTNGNEADRESCRRQRSGARRSAVNEHDLTLNLGPTSSISRADLAAFLLEIAVEGRYIRAAPMVASLRGERVRENSNSNP